MATERNFIKKNVKRMLLREYIKRSIERAGFGGIDVKRHPMGTKITLTCERPGMIIGKKGKTIKELTDTLQNRFEIENPQIEVTDVKNPNLNPHIMAYKLANAIERGWHFRRAGHSTLRRIMESGAKGAQIVLAGKLTGQRHRTEKFKQGHIKFCGETKERWMMEGRAVVKKKLGTVGVKVQIMDPNARLPDEVEILSRESWEIKKVELRRKAEAEAALIEASPEAVKEFVKDIKEVTKKKTTTKKRKKTTTKKKITKTEAAPEKTEKKVEKKAEEKLEEAAKKTRKKTADPEAAAGKTPAKKKETKKKTEKPVSAPEAPPGKTTEKAKEEKPEVKKAEKAKEEKPKVKKAEKAKAKKPEVKKAKATPAKTTEKAKAKKSEVKKAEVTPVKTTGKAKEEKPEVKKVKVVPAKTGEASAEDKKVVVEEKKEE